MVSKKLAVRICFGFLILMFGFILVGCGGSKKAIQIKGSDTMVNLGQAWAEGFMKKFPGESVAVTGGGSGTGIAALVNKTCDVAASSRDMEPKEIKQAQAVKVEPREFRVANDGIAVVVSPQNSASKLTIKQLSQIFSGGIKNWKEVGGPDEKIVALSRDRNSGTHVFFLEHVVKLGEKKNMNEFGTEVLMMPSSQAIVEEVTGNPAAIGYIGLGYVNERSKVVAVAKDSASPYVLPSIQTVLDNSYPIARSLNLYTCGEPDKEIKSFIDYILSDEGQKIVLDMDFVPLKQR